MDVDRRHLETKTGTRRFGSVEKDRFIRHGLPETFVADLKASVEQFEQAVRAVAAARERSKVAKKGIAAAELSCRPLR